MNFASDNAGPMHPLVMDAMVRANEGYQMPYGADTIMDGVRESIRALFEAPEAAVFLVSTGTAANALALATYTKPWDAIFCHRSAHVEEDECGAPEFFSHGAKLTLVDGAEGKMTPEGLRAAIEITGDKGVHGVQRGPVTITQATELGTVYSIAEIKALTEVAHGFGLKTHLDGARFANALVSTNATPAEMTWKAGIDAVSFGATKNGCAMAEAVIFFDPAAAWEFELRRKRGAHLFSKHRYLSAQMEGYLANGLWRDLAAQANAACARLAAGLGELGAELHHAPQANMLFAALPRALHRRAMAAGAKYYLYPFEASLEGPDDEMITFRMVCDWSKSNEEIDALLAAFKS